MATRVFEPKLSVVLHKTVGRKYIAGKLGVSERFSGTRRSIDLTPYLGESGSVRTSKNIRNPAGAFSITLADKMSDAEQDSLYGLIEPMDVVEIRMARDTSRPEYDGLPGRMPIVMRGFVSSVTRGESVTQDGKPVRTVSISGQDYGKIWQIIKIIYLNNWVVGEHLLTALRFAEKYKAGDTFKSASAFLREVVSQVMNQFIAGIIKKGPSGHEPAIESFKIREVLSRGVVSPFGVNSFEGGTLYELLANYLDVGSFNELFIEDDDEGVWVTLRPKPFKHADASKGYINSEIESTYLARVQISDVISINTSRSDGNVANYYFVDGPKLNQIDVSMMRLQATYGDLSTFQLPDTLDFANSSASLYGVRMMTEQTQLLHPGAIGRIDGLPKDDYERETKNFEAWVNDRRRILSQENVDNVVFESGVTLMAGNEKIRPGGYIEIDRGGMKSEMYAVQVDHLFIPFRSFQTTVNFERGTGFIERVRRAGGRESPYLSELRGAVGDA